MKKAKVVESAPSRVLHVRNLPPDCAEPEITSIAVPFGHVERVLLLKGKNQAFVQMHQVQDAVALIQYYSMVQANIRFVLLWSSVCVHRISLFAYSEGNPATSNTLTEQKFLRHKKRCVCTKYYICLLFL